MLWRWDQGRIDYFQLDEVKRLAEALAQYEGTKLPYGDEDDSLRVVLSHHSNRPFLPDSYKVWRNYKRVFGCQLLATEIAGKVVCTELARAYGSAQISGDQYLLHVVRNFYHPSPVFTDYSLTAPKKFLFSAIIKLLVSEYLIGEKQSLDVETIVGTLKAIDFSGKEDLAYYSQAPRIKIASLTQLGDEGRQIRELLVFISQLSFLKWVSPYLYLDVDSVEQATEIFELIEPIDRGARSASPEDELIKLGSEVSVTIASSSTKNSETSEDLVFTEGKQKRSEHLRYERSSKLKDLFYSNPNINHDVCDVCSVDLKEAYPWAPRLIELHHLLPLASAVKVNKTSTSLSDLVPLCPTCHRAVHRYYKMWLKDNNRDDFVSDAEALAVYNALRDNFKA